MSILVNVVYNFNVIHKEWENKKISIVEGGGLFVCFFFCSLSGSKQAFIFSVKDKIINNVTSIGQRQKSESLTGINQPMAS